MTENLNNQNKYSAKLIAKMGMMAAIACVLGLFRFPILPMVSFLTYDFADIPIVISAFAFGPVAGLLITFIVSFIQAFLLGGDQIYGFIMHVISSGTFVLIASLHHTVLLRRRGNARGRCRPDAVHTAVQSHQVGGELSIHIPDLQAYFAVPAQSVGGAAYCK